jgi:hypothetical protein
MIFKAVCAALCTLALCGVGRSQLTTPTTQKISMGGVPIPAGIVTFTPVNAMGIPHSVHRGRRRPQLADGVLLHHCLGCHHRDLPGSRRCSDIPANILYSIQIRNTASQQAFTLQSVPNVTGSTWALDEYAPPAQTTHVQTVQAAIGATVPTSCVMPSVFTKTSTPTGLYYCVGGDLPAVRRLVHWHVFHRRLRVSDQYPDRGRFGSRRDVRDRPRCLDGCAGDSERCTTFLRRHHEGPVGAGG